MSADENEEIAIVGIGCRFPGANDIHEFWRLLENAENHVRDIPKERWNNDKFYSVNPDEPGKIYVRKAGLLSEHDIWDNRLFGISDNEAVRIDPQQRYVLECTHMALEDAGFTRKQLSGTKTGVFIGVMNDDYKTLVGTDHTEDTNFTATGLSTTVIASRVSYVYNLQGPCMTIDTACSSAMMAVHVGCQAIRAGDCDMAICGGVSSILSPDMFIPLCKARMLSRIGQCQTFCDTADGYARGEGCGVVILQSVKEAPQIENIWGVLQTDINQDGRAASPMTAPSSEQQQELLHAIYKKCNIHPGELDYIEVHGTGTPAGDPTEVDAISTFMKSYSVNTQESNHSKKILMGSVKTNIGHTESAAAVAGLIKVLLMMRHEKFVKSLHINENKSNLNTKIRLDETSLDIAVKTENWPKNQSGNRVACVNSFGFGGSNGHAVIKQFSCRTTCSQEVKTNIISENVPYLVCLSGRDREALSKNINRFLTDVDTSYETLSDISYTSLFRRDHFECRTLLFGADIKDTCQNAKLKSETSGEFIPVIPLYKRNIVMVFCGVGTAWSGMGAEMMTNHSVFRHTVRKIDECLKVYSNLCVEEILKCSSDYSDPFLNHIAIFTVQVALYELWKNVGVTPDTIIGQSVGEVAAAYASGALTLSSAVKVIYHRSKILAQQTRGKMTVVGNVAISDIESVCSKYQPSLNIAVYNSPSSCTISGTETGIDSLEREIYSFPGAFIRSLNVACAYHSHLMDGCLSEIASKLKDLQNGHEPHIPQISTVTGEKANPNDLASSTYWAENVRQPVLFMQALRETLRIESTNVYLEIGPRQVLRVHLPNIIGEGYKFLCLPSMNQSNEACFHRSLAVLFELGVDIDFSPLMPYRGYLSPLPRYHFNTTSTLFISHLAKQYLSGFGKTRGTQKYMDKVTNETFNILVNQETTPFVFDHQLLGSVVVPGATYVEAALSGACEIFESPPTTLELSVSFENPCTVEKGRTTLLSLSFQQNTALKDGTFAYSVCLDERTLCTGTVNERKIQDVHEIDISALKMRLTKHRTTEEIYAILEKIGLRYADSLRLIEDCYLNGCECLSVINLPQSVRRDTRSFCLHPAIVDAMFQTSGVLSTEESSRSYEGIPVGFKSIIIETMPREIMFVYTQLIRRTRKRSFYKLILCSEKGAVIAMIDDLVIESISTSIPNDSISYELKWRHLEQLNKTEENYKAFDIDQLIVFGSNRFKNWLTRGEISFTFIEIPNDANAFKELVTEAIQNSRKGRMVVFGLCINCHDLENQSNKAIYDMVLFNVISLQTIFNVKSSLLEEAFPVSVVTEITQQLSAENHEETNYIGAEMWGFVRSALTEMPFDDIRLIDVDLGEENIKPFISLLTNTESGITESLIRNGRIYVSDICLSSSQDIEYIQTNQTGQLENLHLCSKSSKVVSKPFLAYTPCGLNSKNVQTAHDNHSNILVSRVYIKDSHRITTGSCVRILTSDDQAGPETLVKATEFLGWLKENKDSDNSMYGVCFPVTISTVVSVPKCCTFLLKDIPFYKPGLISEIVLLWKVAKQIKTKSNVLIVVCDSNCWRANAILNFLQYNRSKGKVASWVDIDEIAMTRERFTHAILVQIENACDISLLNSVNAVQLVICVNTWLPWDAASVRLQDILNKETVTLKTEEIMSEDSLTKLVPQVLKYLVKAPTNFRRLFLTVTEDSDFLYDFIDVQTAPGELKLPVVRYPSSLFKKNGYYIFVGGTSGLGWELLQYCAKLGAGHLLTLSRRSLSVDKTAEMKKVEILCRCKISHIRADVTDLNSMQSVFNSLKNKQAKVKGIFHGGGVLKDITLNKMTTEDLDIALKPKVLGTLNLHEVSKDMSLDFFLTHSSITAIFGNQGQSNYASGNSFQDSFAFFRTCHGYNAQSINWGALPFGMARESGPDFENRFRRQGIIILNESDVRSCFNEAILTKGVQKIFGIFDWQKVIRNPMYSSSQKKFESVIQHFGIMANAQKMELEEMNELNADFFELPLENQKQCLSKTILSILKDSLPTETGLFDSDVGLYQLGIDSMSAMSITNSIYKTTNVQVPVVFLLSNITTIQRMTDFVLNEVLSHKEKEEPVIKEAVNYEILNGSVTFMQTSILDRLEIEKPSNFIRTISYEMTSRLIKIKDWRTIIICLLQIHPGLRQIFEWNVSAKTFQAKEIEIDERNVPVRIVPFKTIFETSTETRIDPRHQIPMLLHLACKRRTTRMKLFLHAVVVDMQNINIFFRDLELCARYYFLGGPPPVKNSINVTETVRLTLTPRFRGMKTFWKQKFSCNIEPFTFSNSLEAELDEARWCEVEHVFSETQFDDILNFVRKEKVTLYNFVLSVYFLIIYESTGLEVLPLLTNTNMRGYVPALKNVLTRCVNEIPIIGKVNSKSPANDYLRESTEMLNAVTEQGAYPFELIKEEMTSEKLRQNIGRHRFIVDDISTASKRSMKQNVKITEIHHRRHTYETCLFMYQDTVRRKLCLELGFNSKALETSTAKYMLERLESLLFKFVLGKGFATVEDILNDKSDIPEQTRDDTKKELYKNESVTKNVEVYPTECSSKQYLTNASHGHTEDTVQEIHVKGTRIVMDGRLDKQSKHGSVYRCRVVLLKTDFPDSVEYYLRWNSLLTVRQVNLKDVVEIHIKKIAGKYSLFVKKDNSWIQFLAKNMSEAQSWFDQLQKAREDTELTPKSDGIHTHL